jgi:hypothetical protein
MQEVIKLLLLFVLWKGTQCNGENLIHVAQDRGQWQTPLHTVMNLGVSQNVKRQLATQDELNPMELISLRRVAKFLR